jgi:hypothetical protein
MPYTDKMQRLFEREVMTALDAVTDNMVGNHHELMPEARNLNEVRQYWKRRVELVWIQFLIHEHKLQSDDFGISYIYDEG